MRNKKIKILCVSGVLGALVFVLTAYLHIPTSNGYIHVGDAIIYLAACILPWQYAALVGACGACLADCLTGYPMWAPASFVIKAVSVLLFTSKNKKIICGRNLFALPLAALACTLGYYLYEALIYGSLVSPLVGIPASLAQSLASSVLFVAIGLVSDKLNLKSKLNGGL